MNGQPERPDTGSEDDNPELDAANENSPEADGDAEASLADLQAKADENWDRYLRAAAEIENVRKRASRDVEHVRKFALENFGRELLAVRTVSKSGSRPVRAPMPRACLPAKRLR